MSINGLSSLAMISEPVPHERIQEIGSGNKFSEEAKARRTFARRFGDKLCGRTPLSGRQQSLKGAAKSGRTDST